MVLGSWPETFAALVNLVSSDTVEAYLARVGAMIGYRQHVTKSRYRVRWVGMFTDRKRFMAWQAEERNPFIGIFIFMSIRRKERRPVS